LEGRPERIKDLCVFFPDGNVPAWPRRIQDFYDELLQLLIQEASSGKPPTLRIISWIRGRVYQALSMCQTGPEIIDSCAAAIQRHVGLLASPDLFWKSMRALTMTEPHTSYRTPLSLEAGLLGLFEAIRQATPRKAEPLVNELRGGMESPSKKRGGAAAAKAPKPEIVEHAAAAATATATATGTAASVDTVVQSLLSKRAPARKKSSKA
jgi:hypothetical protein